MIGYNGKSPEHSGNYIYYLLYMTWPYICTDEDAVFSVRQEQKCSILLRWI